eukprot:g3034.t1
MNIVSEFDERFPTTEGKSYGLKMMAFVEECFIHYYNTSDRCPDSFQVARDVLKALRLRLQERESKQFQNENRTHNSDSSMKRIQGFKKRTGNRPTVKHNTSSMKRGIRQRPSIIEAMCVMFFRMDYRDIYTNKWEGTLTGAGVAISLLTNYIIMLVKSILHTFWDSSTFILLKGPLRNTKVMTNRADLLLGNAEQEKLYNKLDSQAQKLIQAIVGSNVEDPPWELIKIRKKSFLYHRMWVNEMLDYTRDSENKIEFFISGNLEEAYRGMFHFNNFTVLEETTTKEGEKWFDPPLPNCRKQCRRLEMPARVISDRYACMETKYSYFPQHNFAIVVSEDASTAVGQQIPEFITEGATLVHVRLEGYVLEKVEDDVIKVTHFSSIDLGAAIPNWVKSNFQLQEQIRV